MNLISVFEKEKRKKKVETSTSFLISLIFMKTRLKSFIFNKTKILNIEFCIIKPKKVYKHLKKIYFHLHFLDHENMNSVFFQFFLVVSPQLLSCVILQVPSCAILPVQFGARLPVRVVLLHHVLVEWALSQPYSFPASPHPILFVVPKSSSINIIN